MSQCGYMTPVCSFVCLAVVCAEAYNPDDDEDDDTEPRVVNPKTDEQRHRLQEACRDILLFKTLEQVQQLKSGFKRRRGPPCDDHRQRPAGTMPARPESAADHSTHVLMSFYCLSVGDKGTLF